MSFAAMVLLTANPGIQAQGSILLGSVDLFIVSARNFLPQPALLLHLNPIIRCPKFSWGSKPQYSGEHSYKQSQIREW